MSPGKQLILFHAPRFMFREGVDSSFRPALLVDKSGFTISVGGGVCYQQ